MPRLAICLPGRDLIWSPGAQTGNAPPAAKAAMYCCRPCWAPRSHRHDGAAAGRHGDVDRNRGRRRQLPAGRSRRPWVSSRKPPCRSKNTAGLLRALGRSFRHRRRLPPGIHLLRHDQPPGCRQTGSARRRPVPRCRCAQLVQFAPRLVEVAERAGAAMSLLVQRAAEIPWSDIGNISVLGLSAGASAPEIIVDEIIDAFRARFRCPGGAGGHRRGNREFSGHALMPARCRTHSRGHGFFVNRAAA